MPIKEEKISEICDSYFAWKDLCIHAKKIGEPEISNISTPNIPDFISETLGCFCLNFYWNVDNPGDATDPVTRQKIEFKATSRMCGDLSSFSPKCYFDNLVFLDFNPEDDLVYIYLLNINSKELGKYSVNKLETVDDQRKQKRRPRFSIKESIIIKEGRTPDMVFDFRRKKIILNNQK